MLPHHGRYSYSYLDDRADYSWPGGRRLAFYIATNIECFAFRAGYTQSADGKPTHRDYARYDYGLRVGMAYLLDLFDELGIRVGHNVNSALYAEHGAMLDRVRKRGDEIIAHGRTNSERQDGLWEADEKRLIEEVTETIARHERVRPTGWMGPWRAESSVTPDLLKEAGYRYLMDWPCDDQPIWMRTRSGRILCVPYSLEVNDGTAIARNAHSASEFADILVDHFEEMLRQSEKRPLVMGVGLHPFIIGQPFRVRRLREALMHCVSHARRERVWYTVPGQIADYCYGLPESVVTG
jgi:peptidoglycan/xylan/chitin deacetylase (PgdA/CDA1 family)